MITNFKIFENYETTDSLIKKINLILKNSEEQSYTSGELEQESDIIYYDNDDYLALIDKYYIDEFGYTVYGGYDFSDILYSDRNSYKSLDYEQLEKILDSLSLAIEFDFIKLVDQEEFKSDKDYKEYINLLKTVNKYNIHKYPENYQDFLKMKKAKEFNL